MQATLKHQNKEGNFQIIGIISTLPDYNLVWTINESLDLNFSKKDIADNFSCFFNETPKIILFENLKSSPYFISEAKEFNFFLKIFSKEKKFILDILKILKNTQNINFVSSIDTKFLKKKNIIFFNHLDLI